MHRLANFLFASYVFANGLECFVKRRPNGSFGNSSWVNLNYPNVKGWTSNDSVTGNQVVGIVIGDAGALTYQATVIAGRPSVKARTIRAWREA